MDTIARVRRAFHVQGWSVKRISRELHVSRNTVRKILRSGETVFGCERGRAAAADAYMMMFVRVYSRDRAYDNNDLRQTIASMNAQAVIPSTRSRKIPIPHDPAIYRLRNRIERCFNRLKHFKRFATRYDRRADYFLAFVHIAAIALWPR